MFCHWCFSAKVIDGLRRPPASVGGVSILIRLMFTGFNKPHEDTPGSSAWRGMTSLTDSVRPHRHRGSSRSVSNPSLPSTQHASKLLSHPWIAYTGAQEQDYERDEAFALPASREGRCAQFILPSPVGWSDDRTGHPGGQLLLLPLRGTCRARTDRRANIDGPAFITNPTP